MSTAITTTIQPLAAIGSDHDDRLIEMWLAGRPMTTQDAYRLEVEKLRRQVSKPLNSISLEDLQGFAADLEVRGLQPSSRRRTLAAIKSLLTFCHRLGYLTFDVGRPLRLPKVTDSLHDRILSEAEVTRMLALENHPRNGVMLILLYASAVRVSELCGLRWKDVTARERGGQVTVTGKGNKTRTILLPEVVFSRLSSMRKDASDDAPVFKSRKAGPLHRSQVLRIVRKAALRAGISRKVVVHSFRHAHATHALQRNAPVSLVQQTLGHSSLQTTSKYSHVNPNDSSARFLPL